MISVKIKRKLRGLRKSKTHFAAAFLSLMVGLQPLLAKWLEYKLTPEKFALAAIIIYVVVNGVRWITEQPLEEKGKL